MSYILTKRRAGFLILVHKCTILATPTFPPHFHTPGKHNIFSAASNVFLDAWVEYLEPNNADRIVGLSVTDPFAIVGFILVALMIPLALILLTITSQRSAQAVWDSIDHERRYRLLRLEARRRATAPAAANRYSQRSTKAMLNTPRQVTFILPAITEAPSPPSTPATPIAIPYLDGANIAIPVSPPASASELSPTSSVSTTFTELYERWHRGPQIEMNFEDPDGRRQWMAELRVSLLRQA